MYYLISQEVRAIKTMNFGQLIEYIMRNIFLQKSCRKEAGKLVPDQFLFFKKALYEINIWSAA